MSTDVLQIDGGNQLTRCVDIQNISDHSAGWNEVKQPSARQGSSPSPDRLKISAASTIPAANISVTFTLRRIRKDSHCRLAFAPQ